MDSSNDFFSGRAAAGEEGLLPVSLSSTDPQIPLINLSLLHRRMDSLRQSLSASLHSGSKLHPRQIHLASSQISSAIRHAIFNATALLNSSHPPPPAPPPPAPAENQVHPPFWEPAPGDSELESGKSASFREIKKADCEIVELDAVELLADHVHFCDICGKGFKRDANLRMHMRAHGNQFKTPEALAKPGRVVRDSGTAAGIRFSCPFPGCIRNRAHRKFRPLKSAICVKNHFKRSHCPKTYACNRCHKKSFSVVADLKSHLKHCGECRWKCSCGTSFSRKDKLFGHLALFEGHMPAVVGDPEKEKLKEVEIGEEIDEQKDYESSSGFGSLDALLDGFSTMDECSFEGLLDLQSEEVRLEDLGKV